MGAAFLNGIRRSLAEQLDALSVHALPLLPGTVDTSLPAAATLTYKENVANERDKALYAARGACQIAPAYELSHPADAELMRSKYCVRYELGLCPRLQKKDSARQVNLQAEPLYLRNAGRLLRLDFDCPVCEMTVRAAESPS